VVAAVERARRAGVQVLMNPAPAAPLPASLWTQINILVLNESEASALSGVGVRDLASAAQAAQSLRMRGPGKVLVTLGAQGVVLVDALGTRHAPAHAVRAVDTTAAGDTFIGALAVALCEGQTLDDAVALGQAASALCVTRLGAQASIPYRQELTR
jgi:ribokinase